MKTYYVAIPDNVSENSVFTISTNTEQFIVEAKYDTDEISQTFHHWILIINRVVNNESEERSIVVNPNSYYFPGDEVYSVVTAFEGDTIGINDLKNVILAFIIRGEDE